MNTTRMNLQNIPSTIGVHYGQGFDRHLDIGLHGTEVIQSLRCPGVSPNQISGVLDPREALIPFAAVLRSIISTLSSFDTALRRNSFISSLRDAWAIDAVRPGETRLAAAFRLWRGGVVGSLETYYYYCMLSSNSEGQWFEFQQGRCFYICFNV